MRVSVVKQDLGNIVDGIKKDAHLLSGKTMLISGGEGFLGSYILGAIALLNKKILKRPCRVISIDNYITGRKKRFAQEISDSNFTFLERNVIEAFNIEEKIDYIIHAAGLASPVYYQKYPIETIESAIFGAKNLLEIARRKKVKSFLYFSSSEIYGDPEPNFIPTPEIYRGNVSSIGPRACYDESKRLGETLCMVYHSRYRVPVKIVRPFNIYGPGMSPDDYRVIPTFLTSAIGKKPISVYDSGNQTRTFCYITDAVIGFFKVLMSKQDGEIYNIGNDKNEINMLELARIISSLFQYKINIRTVAYPNTYPKDEPHRRCPDLTKIKKSLLYSPEISLEQGLKRVIKWYKYENKI
ncbi:MAG: NAD-dependent epimerase/dehydratase family protein [Candidatus Levybacteria bacterium]|nr:NAD-dependent epimerase/dehydratase family protein [Candidatus Levybacteria bacterium]